MKQYIVFGGCDYYPLGGFFDYRGQFESEEEALAYAQGLINGGEDWTHVLCIEGEGAVVEEL